MRRRGGHPPASLRRAGHRGCFMPQEQQWHARFLCGQRKAATGGQIQFAHHAPALHDHRPQSRAAQGIDGGTQQRHGIGHHAHQFTARCATQFGPAMGLQYPAHACSPLRSQPQHGAARSSHARCHAHDKSRRARRIVAFGCIEFMNTPPRQPAAQRGIERGNAERVPTSLQRLRALAHQG